MNYEIEAQDKELKTVLEELREGLRRVGGCAAEDKQHRLAYCRQLCQQARTLRAAIALELKAMDEGPHRDAAAATLKERSKQLRALAVELEAKAVELNKEQFDADAEEDGAEATDQLTLQRVAAHGDRVQDKSAVRLPN